MLNMIIDFISANFWYLFIILVLLRYRRDYGILLLGWHIVFGYNEWAYGIIIVCAACSIDTQMVKLVKNKEIHSSKKNVHMSHPESEIKDPDFK